MGHIKEEHFFLSLQNAEQAASGQDAAVSRETDVMRFVSRGSGLGVMDFGGMDFSSLVPADSKCLLIPNCAKWTKTDSRVAGIFSSATRNKSGSVP